MAGAESTYLVLLMIGPALLLVILLAWLWFKIGARWYFWPVFVAIGAAVFWLMLGLTEVPRYSGY